MLLLSTSITKRHRSKDTLVECEAGMAQHGATRATHPSMRALGSALIARPVINSLGSFRLLMSASSSPRNKLEPHEAILLGDEMKAAEDETCNAVVDRTAHVVVRLDGCCFSTYTKGFARPYDLRVHRAMVGTATDLLERFGAATAYTESDEISLVFPPHTEAAPSPLPFNGRVQKVVSVFAGYASARFNTHMLRESFDENSEAALRERVERSEAHFDARVFSLPTLDRLCAYMRWRAVLDCRRNSISMLAQAHFSHDELHCVDAATCVRMLEERKGIRWEETPPFFRFGTYVKKEEYLKAAVNPKTQEQVLARRTRCAARSFALEEEAAKSFLLARYWPAPDEAGGEEGKDGEPVLIQDP